jgi:hypothetical protein
LFRFVHIVRQRRMRLWRKNYRRRSDAVGHGPLSAPPLDGTRKDSTK